MHHRGQFYHWQSQDLHGQFYTLNKACLQGKKVSIQRLLRIRPFFKKTQFLLLLLEVNPNVLDMVNPMQKWILSLVQHKFNIITDRKLLCFINPVGTEKIETVYLTLRMIDYAFSQMNKAYKKPHPSKLLQTSFKLSSIFSALSLNRYKKYVQRASWEFHPGENWKIRLDRSHVVQCSSSKNWYFYKASYSKDCAE